MSDITTVDHFPIEEFACHDGTPYPSEWVDDRLAQLKESLEIIRVAWAAMGAQNPAIIIVSGFRTDAYNVRIGGAKLSQHPQGRAADIRPVDVKDVKSLYGLILHLLATNRLPNVGGLGIYPGWIHVDVRPKPDSGHIAEWSGDGIGSEA
jgi:uncharacterized protein YcbK (DUF882 family)